MINEQNSVVRPAPSAPPMLLRENVEEKVVILTPRSNGLGKILIREDTILTNLHGCPGCRGNFNCTGVKKKWSVLCWGPHSDKKYFCLLILLSLTFGLSLLGSIFFCFTETINNAILSNMVIRNNSLAYTVWKRPNVQPLMRVHIFNYTNWKRVRDGLDPKLIVKEVGPYVYSQQLERVNVKFEGDLVSYQERNQFDFLPEKSVGAHFDQIYVPNLPLLGLTNRAMNMNIHPLAYVPLNSALANVANHPEAFVELSVHRFLWGYDDTIITIAKNLLRFEGFKYNKFGLLVAKNGTVSERFTINTGQSDINKMNIIEKFDGKYALDYWSDRECNRIDASDGSIFPPPMLGENKTVYVLYPNLCRRLPFVYNKTIELDDGVKLYRYKMPENVFDHPSTNPANQCYCEMDAGTCPPRGVINVTACTMGAPALASFPHFYLGDPKLREDVLGLHPDPARHETHVDIHPTLGIALQGKSSLQINIQVHNSKRFSAVRFLPEGIILPVAWVEVEVDKLPESLRSLVYHGTYSTAAVQLGLSVISILTLIVSALCLIRMITQRKKKPCITLRKIPIEALNLTTSNLNANYDVKNTNEISNLKKNDATKVKSNRNSEIKNEEWDGNSEKNELEKDINNEIDKEMFDEGDVVRRIVDENQLAIKNKLIKINRLSVIESELKEGLRNDIKQAVNFYKKNGVVKAREDIFSKNEIANEISI